MSRDVISDEIWAVFGPLFPAVKSRGRPPIDRRTVREATAWRFRTGAPWRGLPEQFGNRNTIYKNFNRWTQTGVWAKLLEHVHSLAAHNEELDWVTSIDSTIVRVPTNVARRSRATQGAQSNYKKFDDKPPDHATGRSRGGLTTKNHLVADGRGRVLAFILTPGQTADTSMLAATMEQISVTGAKGRLRTRPDRLMVDRGYPSRANRTWLRERGIPATNLERDNQVAHRRKRRGRPIDFGDEQRERYNERNVAERRFGKLKQWRGIVMRSDKTARNYHAGLCFAAAFQWL